MGVREIDWFLEQWEMNAKDLRRRMILAPTPREGRQLPGRTVQPERRGETALPDDPAIKGRSTPPRLPAGFPASGKCTSHLGFGLVQALEEETLPQLPLPMPRGRFARPGCVFAHAKGEQP